MGISDWFRKSNAPTPPDRNDDGRVAELRAATRRPYIRIRVGTDAALSPTASKLGGVPYVPVGSQPPPHASLFLAQLDLAALPPLEPLPREGLLQFWISDDDLYGMEAAGGARCVYHASTDAPQRAHVSPSGQHGPLCIADPAGRALWFELADELIPLGDYEWPRFLATHDIDAMYTSRELETNPDDTGHKIGGYCAFTQEDPRSLDDPMFSLLQLDSDEHVFWGDTGIAHWFIREPDLRARNFANVLYYWDCC